MICGDCSVAGHFNEQGVWYADHDRQKEADRAFTQATMLHETCEWPNSCPCHHVVGVQLRKEQP